MSSVKVSGNASGTGEFTIAAPNSNTNRTQTLPDATGTVVLDSATQTLTNKTLSGAIWTSPSSSTITSGTAVASTSGTNIDFTGIPSWVERITVMFIGVSTSGTNNIQVQIGAGSFTTSGYSAIGGAYSTGSATNLATSTTGLIVEASGAAASVRSGIITLTNITSNSWVMSAVGGNASNLVTQGSGSIALGGTLDRLRITTVGGTDTFDAGSINILYE